MVPLQVVYLHIVLSPLFARAFAFHLHTNILPKSVDVNYFIIDLFKLKILCKYHKVLLQSINTSKLDNALIVMKI